MDGIQTHLIAAVAANGVIGYRNQLPWQVPEDLGWFTRETRGKVCVVGRHTYETLPPLPHRTLLVMGANTTKLVRYDAHGQNRAVTDYHEALDLREVIAHAHDLQHHYNAKVAPANRHNRVFVIGGQTLYEQALHEDLVDTMYLTHMALTPVGDRFFPKFDLQRWGIHTMSSGRAYGNVPAWHRASYNRRRGTN